MINRLINFRKSIVTEPTLPRSYKLSVYIILYHDLQFLDDIISRIYPFVDEIVIIDGPYSYSVDILKQCKLFYDENNRPEELVRIINKYSNIKYKYGIFECEEDKRKLGYSLCSHENILLVDSDEFFELNSAQLDSFINSRFSVGGCNIYNMNRNNIQFNQLVKKFVLFKKNIISAEDHLDYLWLIGCKTKEKHVELMDTKNSVGTIYQQTLNRNKFNNIIKFIFYVSLYYRNNNATIRLFDNYDINTLLSELTISEVLDIFYHCRFESFGIPGVSENNICTVLNNVPADILKYDNNHITGFFTDNRPCLRNIDACFLLDTRGNKTANIVFENVKQITVTIYNVCIDIMTETYTYSYNMLDDTLQLEFPNSSSKLLNTVIKFNCDETIDNTQLYKIKTICFPG